MSESVMIVGGGTMGAGIAFVVANAGYDVVIVEPLLALHARIREQLRKNAERAGDAHTPDRVGIIGGFYEKTLDDIVLAIEAVPERLDLKRNIFADLVKLVSDDVLLATNTSSLAVSEIFVDVPKRERTFGLHFFNPPPAMQLVEVVRDAQTSDATIEKAQRYVERFGKIGVLTADTPGFIVNRVARPFYLEAMRALERGDASAEAIDAAAREAGFRMGPFELMDLIGLDVNLATSESVYARLRAERLKPAEIQRRLVTEGKLGRKSGRGFYTYPQEKTHQERDENAQQVVSAMIASVLGEARMLVDEGVASVENVNLAMKYGVNYPESVRI
jgi:3-hydroxybutyryl-CoA dehydrogenase